MSIGGTELLIIVIFGFLLFGPDKLPQMGRTLGRALRQFRETQQRMTSVVQSEVIDPMAATINANAQASPQAAAAHADDADADAEGTADAAPAPRKETFAERRARLAAEKAAAEKAARGDAEDAAGDEPETTSAEPVSTEEAPAATAGSETVEAAVSEPAEEAVDAAAEAARATADLYARRPRKHAPAAVDAADAGRRFRRRRPGRSRFC